MNILEQLTRELNLKLSQVENTVALIDEGNTIPFIAVLRCRRHARFTTGTTSQRRQSRHEYAVFL